MLDYDIYLEDMLDIANRAIMEAENEGEESGTVPTEPSTEDEQPGDETNTPDDEMGNAVIDTLVNSMTGLDAPSVQYLRLKSKGRKPVTLDGTVTVYLEPERENNKNKMPAVEWKKDGCHLAFAKVMSSALSKTIRKDFKAVTDASDGIQVLKNALQNDVFRQWIMKQGRPTTRTGNTVHIKTEQVEAWLKKQGVPETESFLGDLAKSVRPDNAQADAETFKTESGPIVFEAFKKSDSRIKPNATIAEQSSYDALMATLAGAINKCTKEDLAAGDNDTGKAVQEYLLGKEPPQKSDSEVTYEQFYQFVISDDEPKNRVLGNTANDHRKNATAADIDGEFIAEAEQQYAAMNGIAEFPEWTGEDRVKVDELCTKLAEAANKCTDDEYTTKEPAELGEIIIRRMLAGDQGKPNAGTEGAYEKFWEWLTSDNSTKNATVGILAGDSRPNSAQATDESMDSAGGMVKLTDAFKKSAGEVEFSGDDQKKLDALKPKLLAAINKCTEDEIQFSDDNELGAKVIQYLLGKAGSQGKDRKSGGVDKNTASLIMSEFKKWFYSPDSDYGHMREFFEKCGWGGNEHTLKTLSNKKTEDITPDIFSGCAQNAKETIETFNSQAENKMTPDQMAKVANEFFGTGSGQDGSFPKTYKSALGKCKRDYLSEDSDTKKHAEKSWDKLGARARTIISYDTAFAKDKEKGKLEKFGSWLERTSNAADNIARQFGMA